ncbi:MAG: hypothetical protein AAB956_01145, partial [Patescibacteria group bacterium]
IGDGTTATTGQMPSAADIRVFLKKNGATDELLAKYTDQQLQDLYIEVGGGQQLPAAGNPLINTSDLTNTPLAPSVAAGSPPPLTAEQKAAIQKMSGAELRQFLIKGGADAKVLQQFDDKALETVFKQSLGL